MNRFRSPSPSRPWSVQRRLDAFSAIALAFLAALGFLAFWSIHRLARSAEAMLETQKVLRSHLEADMAHDAVHAAAFAAVLAGEEQARSGAVPNQAAERERGIRRELAEEVATLRGGLARVEAASFGKEANRLARAAGPHLATYVERAERVVDDAFRDPAAARALLPELEESFEQVKTDFASLSDAVERVAQEEQEAGERLAWIVRVLIPLAFLGAAIALLRHAVRVTQSIVRPLGRAVEVAHAVARGDLGVAIEGDGGDGRDEIGELFRSLRTMVGSLSEIVVKVREGAAEIDGTAREVAAGHLSLSARTATQAATVEETAASVDELSAIVRHSASLAQEAHELAESTSDVAADGGRAVDRVVETMSALEAASLKIVEIVTLIDEIAFQTNVLALNAAIEAAQAGEQGRGFAVVAAEVRQLAERAAAAARQVRQQVEGSVARVSLGTQLVTTAGTTISTTVGSTKRVALIMSQIAATSTEQSTGLEQIHRAIARLDDVAQRNSQLVDEATTAAADLATQAHKLVQTVSTFRVSESTQG